MLLDAVSLDPVLLEVANGLHDDPAWQTKFLEPPEMLGVQTLSPSNVTIRVLMKVRPKEQWGVSREFKRRVKNALEGLGVRSSLPQMSLALTATGLQVSDSSSADSSSSTGSSSPVSNTPSETR